MNIKRGGINWKEDIQDKEIIDKLLNIVYDSAKKSSDYQIKDNNYADLFMNFNYFQDYVVIIKTIIRDNKLDTIEKEHIVKLNDDLIEVKQSRKISRLTKNNIIKYINNSLQNQ